MKKFLCLILVLLFTVSLVACGESENPIDNVSDTVLSDKHVNESKKMDVVVEEGVTITPNGTFPDKVEDVRSHDQYYYFNEAINALIQLDEEKMRLYVDEEECEAILRIKQDKRAYDLWQHTVGNITYMPSIGELHGRSMNIVYAVWYQDQVNHNASLPDIVCKMSYNDIVKIYNAYYDTTPIVLSGILPDDFYVQDGYIKFHLSDALILLGIYDLTTIMEPDELLDSDDNIIHYENALWELVLGSSVKYAKLNSYDDIRRNGEYALFDAIMSLDIDAAENIAEEAILSSDNAYGKEDYQLYIKNPAKKEVFKAYLKNNVSVYRTYDDIFILIKPDANNPFGTYDHALNNYATESERALMKNTPCFTVIRGTYSEEVHEQFFWTFGEILFYADQVGEFDEPEDEEA